ncbi:hypothetical protein HDV01_003636 [Terramyces sp. JEL0728]|nr:hypothetical protein HDV01_003636 [Terramyces sp. JEL0728]
MSSMFWTPSSKCFFVQITPDTLGTLGNRLSASGYRSIQQVGIIPLGSQWLCTADEQNPETKWFTTMNTTVSASVPAVFQIAWLNNSYCDAPPNVMYSFTGITNSLYNQTINDNNLNTCGNNLVSMNGGCCFSTIDTSYFSGYSSLVQRAPFTDKSNFPVAANGASYCHIQQNSLQSLYGYSDIWILADGSCIDNLYSCRPTGEFDYYSQTGCTGQPSSLQLDTNTSSFSFADMGNIKGEFMVVGDGSESYRWTAYIPSSLLDFKYQVPMEIIALICYITAIVISIMVLLYFINKYNQTKSSYMRIVVVSQTLWSIWLLLDFLYLNIKFQPNNNSPQIYAEIKAVIFNLASLTTVLNTANFIIGFRVLTGFSTEIVLYSTILLLHLLFAGGNYFTIYFLTTANGSVWQKWIQLAPFWSLLMFAFNTLPAFSIAVSIIQTVEAKLQLSTLQATKRLLLNDKTFTGLVFCQALNAIFITSLYYIQLFTQIPGSDRNYLAMFGVFGLVYALHAGINCLFIEHIRLVLKSKTKPLVKKPKNTDVMILRPLSSLEDESSFTDSKSAGTVSIGMEARFITST